MSAFENAVNEGIRCGLEKAWTDQCEGRDDPEERCPMRLADGCACYYRASHKAPFWRRWRMDKPTRPPQGARWPAAKGGQGPGDLAQGGDHDPGDPERPADHAGRRRPR